MDMTSSSVQRKGWQRKKGTVNVDVIKGGLVRCGGIKRGDNGEEEVAEQRFTTMDVSKIWMQGCNSGEDAERQVGDM
ncbi:hypothetical protein VNO78_05725 [Psophocarpus tetragonolobus]|uniref:Uncharacterized protein n=1 Tax=Psophocarpus tetragonolobus TaxID=3891 RepID=A0AAN9XR44_PSOTE